jgi:hypothetical protein
MPRPTLGEQTEALLSIMLNCIMHYKQRAIYASNRLTAIKQEEAATNNTNNNDVTFERKLDLATAGLSSYIRDHLLTKIPRKNAATIVDHILSMNSEIHVSDN